MLELLGTLFFANFWTPSWEWLDVLIVVVYYAIPTMLIYSLYKGRDVPFHWMFLVFGVFYLVCGSMYVVQTWKLWYPNYWLSDFMKAITALFCGGTGLLLLTLMPFALALPSPAKLEAANLALEKEIQERLRVESALSKLALELEKRVEERTAKLKSANVSLRQEIRDRHKSELALRESEAQFKEQATKLEVTLQELQKTQAQLIQTEKMSSLGQLVAGVAHEINNPVNFIHGNLIYLNQYTQDLLHLLHLYVKYYPAPMAEIKTYSEAIDLNFLMEDLPKILSSMQLGTDRIRQIVLNLKNFSRLDQAEMKSVDIHEGIDSTLLILQHRLKAKPNCLDIQVIKKYGNLPLVECYAGQLNQVFMNILSNAIEALDDRNLQYLPKELQIEISTEVTDSDWVAIRIADNGPGMTEEVSRKLFDPFFTTKPIGKGTGLGLSISHQIVVEKHGGKLQCLSAPKQGTQFVISIPIRQHHPQPAKCSAAEITHQNG